MSTAPAYPPPNWPAVIRRSLETATRASTATAVGHLFAMAEVAKLKRNVEAEIRIASIPGDWNPPVPGVFVTETMNDLADAGEKMGADPSSWSTNPPWFAAASAQIAIEGRLVARRDGSSTPSTPLATPTSPA